jgi:hypothetical protein
VKRSLLIAALMGLCLPAIPQRAPNGVGDALGNLHERLAAIERTLAPAQPVGSTPARGFKMNGGGSDPVAVAATTGSRLVRAAGEEARDLEERVSECEDAIGDLYEEIDAIHDDIEALLKAIKALQR